VTDGTVTLFEHRQHIDAPIEVVFELLSSAEGLCQWIARAAEVELSAGGRIQWTHDNGDTMVGRIIEVDPPHRLVFSYGWQGDMLGLPPEATLVTIVLAARADGTELHLRHENLPVQTAQRHVQGWQWFLGRLGEVGRATAAMSPPGGGV